MLLVSYDIPSDRRRRRLAKVLEKWGRRVQYSVFECELEPEKLGQLKSELRREMNLKADSVRIYDTTGQITKTVIVIGTGPEPGAPDEVML